jgi:hypothetical protein
MFSVDGTVFSLDGTVFSLDRTVFSLDGTHLPEPRKAIVKKSPKCLDMRGPCVAKKQNTQTNEVSLSKKDEWCI